MGSEAEGAPELSQEDASLLAEWLAGPGARPTEADSVRWAAQRQAAEDSGHDRGNHMTEGENG